MATNVVQLVDSLTLTNSNTTGYSPSVTMAGANAVQLTLLLAVLTATSLTPSLEGSNDLSNWSTITTGWPAVSGVGYSVPAAGTAIAFQYVRVKFVLAGTGTVIFSANLATAQL